MQDIIGFDIRKISFYIETEVRARNVYILQNPKCDYAGKEQNF